MFSSINNQNAVSGTKYADRGASDLRSASPPIQYDTINIGGNSPNIGRDALLDKAKNLKAQLMTGKPTSSPYKGTTEEQLVHNERFMSGVNNAKGDTLNEIKENTDAMAERYKMSGEGLKALAGIGMTIAIGAAALGLGFGAFGILEDVAGATAVCSGLASASEVGATALSTGAVDTAFAVAAKAGLFGAAVGGLALIPETLSNAYKSFSGKLQEWKDYLAPKETVTDYQI